MYEICTLDEGYKARTFAYGVSSVAQRRSGILPAVMAKDPELQRVS